MIDQADKSNSLVVIGMPDYNTKIYLHLNDRTTYTAITHDNTDQFGNEIINEIESKRKW